MHMNILNIVKSDFYNKKSILIKFLDGGLL